MAKSQATAGVPASVMTNQGTALGQGAFGNQMSSPPTQAQHLSFSDKNGLTGGTNSPPTQSKIHPTWYNVHNVGNTVWVELTPNQTSATVTPCLLPCPCSTTGISSLPIVSLSVLAAAPQVSTIIVTGIPNTTPPPRRRSDTVPFNKYLNASDLLEDFIKFCKLDQISKKDFLDLPMRLFMMWLVLRAAEDDDLEPPQDIIEKLDRELKALTAGGQHESADSHQT